MNRSLPSGCQTAFSRQPRLMAQRPAAKRGAKRGQGILSGRHGAPLWAVAGLAQAGMNSRGEGRGGFPGAGELFSGTGESFPGSGESFSVAGESFSGAGKSFSDSGESFSGSGESFSGSGELFSGSGESFSGSGESFSGSGESFSDAGESFSGGLKGIWKHGRSLVKSMKINILPCRPGPAE